MLLRASSELQGEKADLHAVTEGSGTPSGVRDDDVLLPFAEAAVGRDVLALASAREALAKRLGDAALVDTACIVANFQRMVRIADGTGIPLDTPLALVSVDLRSELGIDDYGSADATPPVRGARRLLGKTLQRLLPLLMRLYRPPRP